MKEWSLLTKSSYLKLTKKFPGIRAMKFQFTAFLSPKRVKGLNLHLKDCLIVLDGSDRKVSNRVHT